MKIGIFNTTTLTLLMTCACVLGICGCRSDQGTDGSSDGVVSVPHGYMARLEQVHDGRMIGFGPFVGYYFRPEDPGDLSRLRFVCFNEKRFYSLDMPDGAKLYEGTAVRTTLPLAPPGRPQARDAWMRSLPCWADSPVRHFSPSCMRP